MSLWYYQDPHGQLAGPFTGDAFHDLRESGMVRDTTLIWRTGWSDWTTFADIWIRGGPPTSTDSKALEPSRAPASSSSQLVDRDTETSVNHGQRITSVDPDESNQLPPPFRLVQPIAEEERKPITYASCSICHEQWAEHLLFGNGHLRVCASCLKAHEEKRKARQRLRARGGGAGSGITTWVYRLLIVGLILGGVIVFSLRFLQDVSNKPLPSSEKATPRR